MAIMPSTNHFNSMSKTIDLQIEKSKKLIEGLRAHMDEFVGKGVSASDLDTMTDNLKRLSDSSKAAEAIREQLSEQVKTTNNILAQVKEAYAKTKAVVRNNYPQEEWINYGVTDKR